MPRHPTLLTALVRTLKDHRAQSRTWRHTDRLDDHLRRDTGLPPLGPAPRNPFTEGW